MGTLSISCREVTMDLALQRELAQLRYPSP
jgi:hypothetical protein